MIYITLLCLHTPQLDTRARVAICLAEPSRSLFPPCNFDHHLPSFRLESHISLGIFLQIFLSRKQLDIVVFDEMGKHQSHLIRKVAKLRHAVQASEKLDAATLKSGILRVYTHLLQRKTLSNAVSGTR